MYFHSLQGEGSNPAPVTVYQAKEADTHIPLVVLSLSFQIPHTQQQSITGEQVSCANYHRGKVVDIVGVGGGSGEEEGREGLPGWEDKQATMPLNTYES